MWTFVILTNWLLVWYRAWALKITAQGAGAVGQPKIFGEAKRHLRESIALAVQRRLSAEVATHGTRDAAGWVSGVTWNNIGAVKGGLHIVFGLQVDGILEISILSEIAAGPMLFPLMLPENSIAPIIGRPHLAQGGYQILNRGDVESRTGTIRRIGSITEFWPQSMNSKELRGHAWVPLQDDQVEIKRGVGCSNMVFVQNERGVFELGECLAGSHEHKEGNQPNKALHHRERVVLQSTACGSLWGEKKWG